MPTTICRHIKTNGARCGSPALTSQIFCYFHNELRKTHAKPQPDLTPVIIHPTHDDGYGNQRNPLIAEYYRPLHPELDLPPLEDHESIQVAISVVVGALAANRLDPKRASMLLYALQVASSNCSHLKLTPLRSVLVRETVLAPHDEQIAPDVEPENEILLQKFLNGELECEEGCDCEDCTYEDDEDADSPLTDPEEAGSRKPLDAHATLRRMIILIIVLILLFGGGGYAMGPGYGYYGGGGIDLILVLLLLYFIFGRRRSL